MAIVMTKIVPITSALSALPKVGNINDSKNTTLPTNIQSSDTTNTIQCNARLLLRQLSEIEKGRFAFSKQVLSFDEFLQEAMNNPRKYLRSTSQYAVDALDYWNRRAGVRQDEKIEVLGNKVKPLAFAKRLWEPDQLTDRTGICGQEIVLDEIYNILLTNAQKEHPDYMIILHGPNATGKTLILETLFQALENYSKDDDGVLYTFNWVFKNANNDNNDFSFDSMFPVYSGPNALKSPDYHTISPNEVGVTIPANLNTNPIFLLNKETRLKLINALEKQGKLPPGFNKDHIISGNLDSSSQKIFDALWKHYDGDLNKVLDHIHVTRWSLSEQNRKGLVIIPPEETSEAQLIPITPEIDWDSLPLRIKEAFRSAGLHELEGPFPQANRGHIFFDDMLKGGQISRYLFLLRTAEKGKITISTPNRTNAADEKLDLIIWGNTNDTTLHALQQEYNDWDSLKGRFVFIPVGYERRYKSVAEIYEGQLKQMISPDSARHISPHALEIFALWTTMTYLFPPTNREYYEHVDPDKAKSLRNAVMKLNVLQKALLYQDEDPYSYVLSQKEESSLNDKTLSSEEKGILKHYLKEIANEYNFGVGKHKFLFYEGGTGLDPRDARRILDDAIKARPTECFSILEVFDTLEERIKHGLDFETGRKTYVAGIRKAIDNARQANKSLVLPSVPDFPTALNMFELAQEHARKMIRYEVQTALRLLKPDTEHIDNLSKYVEHVRASRGKRDVEMKWRDKPNQNKPDEQFMQSMEKLFNQIAFTGAVNENERDKFRQNIVETYGQWKAEHEDHNPMDNIEKLFPDLLKKMKAKDLEDNHKKLLEFLYVIKAHQLKKDSEAGSQNQDLREERTRLSKLGLESLYSMGYCEKCIPKLIDFAFNSPEYRTGIAPIRT